MADEQILGTQLFQGNCLDVLPKLKDCSVDLIVTSPSYADQRKDTYGGVHADKYVEWFLPIAAELRRVLKKVQYFLREGIESDRQLDRAA